MIKQELSKRKYFNIGGILIFSLLISGCVALGTKTIWKSNNLNNYETKKIGYSQLASEATMNKIKENSSIIYQSAIEEFYAEKTIKSEKHNLSSFESIEKIDTSEIIKLCQENSLDGYLCTQIKYLWLY